MGSDRDFVAEGFDDVFHLLRNDLASHLRTMQARTCTGLTHVETDRHQSRARIGMGWHEGLPTHREGAIHIEEAQR